MISGTNTSNSFFGDIVKDVDDIDIAIGCGENQNLSMTDVINDLRERKKNVESGGINCIPFPFKRFRNEIPGIEQEQYVVITAPTKGGKSQFGSYVYLYHTIDYAFSHPDQCSVHVIYFALEESQMRIKHRYISHLLYKLDNIRLSPTDLRSTDADFPLSDGILNLLETPRYKERLAFFDSCVQFETEDTNPTGILRVCEDYAKSVGEYKSIKKKSRSGSGQDVEVFQSYTPYDKKHYKIVFIDHIGLVDLERGMTLKQSMDKLSEYCVKYLRNRYKYTVVAIQQQAMESEGLDAIKQKRMMPSVATLGDTKYTARDANLVIGLFDPYFFGLPSWQKYTIQDANGDGLLNYSRFAQLIRGRDGEQGGICPLFFDGAVCDFEELPVPSDANIQLYYARAKRYKQARKQKKVQQKTTTLTLLSLFSFKPKWKKTKFFFK